jgi:hypothetical protein
MDHIKRFQCPWKPMQSIVGEEAKTCYIILVNSANRCGVTIIFQV